MKLNSIDIKNVKGTTKIVELEKNNVLIGENGSGKTTIINALEFALFGNVEGAKKPGDIHLKFGSDTTMGVELDFDTTLINRTIIEASDLDNEGNEVFKYSQKANMESASGKVSGATKVNAAITSEINTLDLAFKFNDLVSLSSTERKKFILSLMNTNETTIAEIIEKLEEVIEIKDIFEEEMKILKKIKTKVDVLEEAHAVSKRTMLDYRKNTNDEKSAVKKLNELKNDHTQNTTLLKGKLELKEGYVKERETLIGDIAADKITTRLIKERLEKVIKLEADLAKKKEFDFDKTITGTKTLLEDTDSKLKIKSNALEDTNKFIKELDDKITKCSNEINDINQKLVDPLKNDNIKNGATISALKQQINIVESSDGLCPLTKEKCEVKFDTYLSEKRTELDQVQADFTNTDNAIKAHQEEVDKLNKELEEYVKAKKLHTEEVGKLERTITELKEKSTKHTTTISTLEDKKVTASEAIDKIEKDIVDLKKPLELKQDPLLVDALLGGYTTNIKEIDDFEKEVNSKITMIEAQETTLADLRLANKKYELWKEVEAALGYKGMLGDFISSNLGPMTDKINENLVALGRSETFYFDLLNKQNQSSFNFGLNRNGNKIMFEGLSGAEQMIVSLAVLIAFYSYIDSKFKLIIIDEVNKVFGNNTNCLVDGLIKLNDQLDCVILSGAVYLDKFDTKDFNVIQL